MIRTPASPMARQLTFGSFTIDLDAQRLWHHSRAVPLRPKSWEVLVCLVQRCGVLVTKSDLQREVWRDAAVVEDTLTQSIGELRRVFGDDPRKPRFIETVHRRGFRFVAEVKGAELLTGTDGGRASSPGKGDADSRFAEDDDRSGSFVGRVRELEQLHAALGRARDGKRQLLFVTGEAGIGKTTLIDEFLRSPAASEGDLCVLYGQCVHLHGTREPFMPILQALEQLLRSPDAEPLIARLRRTAPHWYGQLPSLWPEAEFASLPSEQSSPQGERMLREIVTFLEELSARRTAILVLEDLHWSDAATADVMLLLAQRRHPARLLVIGTYRPAEASVSEHPIRVIKQTLQTRRRSSELPLGYLSLENVGTYLSQRFGQAAQHLAPAVHDRSDGNPLFMVVLADELIRSGSLVRLDGQWTAGDSGEPPRTVVPRDLREMITLQFRELGAEHRAILEAASVVGLSFSRAVVARVLERDVEEVERVCRNLLQEHSLLKRESDGEDSPARLRFLHALHRQVIYEEIDETRRSRLHQKVGEILETECTQHAAANASELSVHFERAGDHARALRYLSECAERARQGSAHRESVSYLEHSLALLDRLPANAERDRQELDLRLLLGVSLNVTHGYASAAVRRNAECARRLCKDVNDTRRLMEVLHILWYAHFVSANAEASQASFAEIARIAADHPTPEFQARADLARGRMSFWRGQFPEAIEILEPLIGCIDAVRIDSSVPTYGVEPIVAARMQSGLARWFLGFPEQARAHARAGLEYAATKGNPFDQASALTQSAMVELFCGDTGAAAALATRGATLCEERGVAFFSPLARFLCGTCRVQQGDIDGGLEELLLSLDEQRALSGSFFCDFIFAFLAAAHGEAGQWEEGIRRADEGIAVLQTSLERVYAAELWRIKGELLIRAKKTSTRRGRTPGGQAEACFRQALDIARQQQSRSLELRAATSLAGLMHQRGERDEAGEFLEPIYAAFTEGFDTKDLVHARTLLRSL